MLHFLQKDDLLGRLIGKEDANLVENIKSIPMPDPYGQINHPVQLDMLWWDFFATGRIKPIQKLVSVLEYSKYAGAIGAYKKSKKTQADLKKAMKDAIFQALVWSLRSNCRHHELVRNYCLYILQKEKLSDVQRLHLAIMMEKFFPDKVKVNIPKQK